MKRLTVLIAILILAGTTWVYSGPEYSSSTAKIDDAAVLGLSGTNDSLAYKVHEIEKHFHSAERWLGISANQAGNDWALEDTANVFRAISGNAVYGADTNDEAKVIGTDDGPYVTGMVKFDFHRIFISALSEDDIFTFRLVWGTDTMANAITAGQFSTIIVANNPAGSKAGGYPVDVQMPRKTWGTDKIWVQCKCATDNATADFYIGVHEYAG